jgi:NADPH:quinone reductase-like Zn-dependent oxidoreductase
MKAVIWTKYGSPDGLQLREIAQPVPREDEMLIRVHAAAASTPDTEFRRLKLPLPFALPLRAYLGLRRPTRITILGNEFAGEVVSAGPAVSRFKPGDQLFGYTGLGMGTYAEYLCLREKPAALASVLAEKPANMTYEQAAVVPFGGLEALNALRKADVQPGQSVLVNGAGGGIGTCAVQLARYYGARVTGVDSTGKLEMLRELGAEQVIDYTQEDFTKRGQTYDVIFDTVGKASFSGCIRSLKENGTYLNANPGLFSGVRRRWATRSGGKRIFLWTASYTTDNLLALKALIETGAIQAVIDRRYPLEQAAEAHRYVDSGQKKGNVVLTLEPA